MQLQAFKKEVYMPAPQLHKTQGKTKTGETCFHYYQRFQL